LGQTAEFLSIKIGGTDSNNCALERFEENLEMRTGVTYIQNSISFETGCLNICFHVYERRPIQNCADGSGKSGIRVSSSYIQRAGMLQKAILLK
jgi:hypothetical protein